MISRFRGCLALHMQLAGAALLVAVTTWGMEHANAQPTVQTARDVPAPAIPSIEDAPIALLVDLSGGQVLHARNADRRFVPASITKAMTLYHAFELIEEGRLDPRQTITMSPEAWREWGGRGSTMWLGANERASVDDLLMAIANVSANDGAVALAEGQAGSVARWTAGMNARARALGMTDSHFATPNGWPDEGRTFTSARDLVKLARAMIERHPAKFARYIGRPSFSYNGIEQYNHDPLIGRARGADGIKTGYTNEAGFGYLGTAVRDGQRLALVVAGSPRAYQRNRAARSYLEWGYDAFDRERLFDRGDIVALARVQGGKARHVALRAPRDIAINVPPGRGGGVVMSVRYAGPLQAPITQGNQVATLMIEVPGLEPTAIALQANEDVGRAGVLARILNGFAGWFS